MHVNRRECTNSKLKYAPNGIFRKTILHVIICNVSVWFPWMHIIWYMCMNPRIKFRIMLFCNFCQRIANNIFSFTLFAFNKYILVTWLAHTSVCAFSLSLSLCVYFTHRIWADLHHFHYHSQGKKGAFSIQLYVRYDFQRQPNETRAIFNIQRAFIQMVCLNHEA